MLEEKRHKYITGKSIIDNMCVNEYSSQRHDVRNHAEKFYHFKMGENITSTHYLSLQRMANKKRKKTEKISEICVII